MTTSPPPHQPSHPPQLAAPGDHPPPASDIATGHVRRAGWTRVTHGAYRRTGSPDRLADLRAWQAVLPPGSAFTGLTAVEVYGWWVPGPPTARPTWVAVPANSRVRRPGLRVVRRRRAEPPRVIDGLCVEAPGPTIRACAAALGLLDLVLLLDGARAAGVPAHELRPRSGERGCVRLREAHLLSDPRAESPWESTLRMLHRAIGAEVEPQHTVRHDGAFVARADLWLVGTRTIQEYDGAHHLTPGGQHQDMARARRLNEAGWVRNAYSARDLLGSPATVLRDVDRALGRSHRAGRLDGWSALMRDSLLTATGRTRVWG